MKAAALIIFSLAFGYRIWLNRLQARSKRNPVPANVADVYDEAAYQKWRAYQTEKLSHSLLADSCAFAVQLAMLATDAYAWFAALFPEGWVWRSFAVVLLGAVGDLAALPFAWRDTMEIEAKYGFNRATKQTFWTDQVKEFVIGLALSLGIACLLGGLHRWLGDGVLAAFAVALFALALLISFLYPWLSRIFNRFTPLEEGELKEKLTALLEKHGFTVRAIQVMDASRRTTKSNAYFTGFGKMKTIVLYDNLVRTMTPDEICAVFAHEMGHGLHRDTLKNQALAFVQMAILAVLAWLTLRTQEVFSAFGFTEVNYAFAVILIMSVGFALISPLYGLLTNWRSRRAEYAADAQAAQEGCGEALVSGLKKLARENLSDLSPSPLLVKLEYSHPTLSQRIAAIEGAAAESAEKVPSV